MFGTRQEGEEPRELFAQARTTYESGENRKTPVRLYARIGRGSQLKVAAEDAQGTGGQVEGPCPRRRRTSPHPGEGGGPAGPHGGTPLHCEKVTARVEKGPVPPPVRPERSAPPGAGGALAAALRPPERRTGEYHPGVRYENPKAPPALTVSVRRAEQITPELLARQPDRVYLPCEEGAACPDAVRRCQEAGVTVAVLLPRVCWDRELPLLEKQLEAVKELGVRRPWRAAPGTGCAGPGSGASRCGATSAWGCTTARPSRS